MISHPSPFTNKTSFHLLLFSLRKDIEIQKQYRARYLKLLNENVQARSNSRHIVESNDCNDRGHLSRMAHCVKKMIGIEVISKPVSAVTKLRDHEL